MTPRIDFDKLPLVVCVSGSRGFPHPGWVTALGKRFQPGTQLVHGDCPGSPDAYAERGIQTANARARIAAGGLSRDEDVPMPFPSPKRFPANWKPQGRRGPTDRGAGPKRNLEMLTWVASQGGVLLAFGITNEEGELTNGTTNAVEIAKRMRVPSYLLMVMPDGSVRYELDRFDDYLLPATITA